MPLVSIGIPAYNATNFLEIAVKSVINQGFTDWELIIVNDGSKDHTGDLAERLAAGDSRIRAIHQDNRGLAATRNTANAAMGDSEYAIFLDHDDVWEPDLLTALIVALKRDKSVVGAYCLGNFIDATGNPLQPGFLEHHVRNRRYVQRHSSFPLPLEATTGLNCLAIENCIPSPGCALLRREVMARVGEWEARSHPCEDYEMWLRMSLTGNFAMVNKLLFHYRRHQSNMSAALSKLRRGNVLARKFIVSHPGVTEEQRRIMRAGYRIREREQAANKLRQVPNSLMHRQFKDASKDIGRAACAIWRSIAGLGI